MRRKKYHCCVVLENEILWGTESQMLDRRVLEVMDDLESIYLRHGITERL